MDENLSLEAVPLQRPHLFAVQRRKGGSSAEGSRQNSSSSSSNRCIKSSTGLLAKCMLPIECRSTHSKSLLVGPPLCPAAAHAAAATTAAAATGYTVPRPVHAALHTCNLHSYRGASTSVDQQPQRAHLLQGPFKGPPWGPPEGGQSEAQKADACTSPASLFWSSLQRRGILELQQDNKPNWYSATSAAPAAPLTQHTTRSRCSNPDSSSSSSSSSNSSNSSNRNSSSSNCWKNSNSMPQASWACLRQPQQRNPQQQEQQQQQRAWPATSDGWSCARCCSSTGSLLRGRLSAAGLEALVDGAGRSVAAAARPAAPAAVVAAAGDSASPFAASTAGGRGYGRCPPTAAAAADEEDEAAPGSLAASHCNPWSVRTAKRRPLSAWGPKRGNAASAAVRCSSSGAQVGPTAARRSRTSCLAAAAASAQRSNSTSCSSSSKTTASTRTETATAAVCRHAAAGSRRGFMNAQQQPHKQHIPYSKEQLFRRLPHLQQKQQQQGVQQVQKQAQQQRSVQHISAPAMLHAVEYASADAGGCNQHQPQRVGQLQQQQHRERGAFGQSEGTAGALSPAAEAAASAAASAATGSTTVASSDAAVAAAAATVAVAAPPIAAAAPSETAAVEKLVIPLHVEHSSTEECQLLCTQQQHQKTQHQDRKKQETWHPRVQQLLQQQQLLEHQKTQHQDRKKQETWHPRVQQLLQQRQLYAGIVLKHFCRALQRSAFRRPWRQLLLHAAHQHALQRHLQQAQTPGQQQQPAQRKPPVHQQQQYTQQPVQQQQQQGAQCVDIMDVDLHSLSLRDEASSRDACMRLEDYRRRLRQQQLRHKQQQQQQKEQQRKQQKQLQQLIQQLATAAQELKKANDQQEALQGRLAAALFRLQQLEQQQSPQLQQQHHRRQGAPRLLV